MKHNKRLALDPCYPEIDEIQFSQWDWKYFYCDVKEAVSPDVLKNRGKEGDIRMYIDIYHAGDKEKWRYRTGFLIYMNKSLVHQLSKKQPMIETSVFGAKFVAMKIGLETLRGLRYKLSLMGIPLSGPLLFYGYSMSVIPNIQKKAIKSVTMPLESQLQWENQ